MNFRECWFWCVVALIVSVIFLGIAVWIGGIPFSEEMTFSYLGGSCLGVSSGFAILADSMKGDKK
ncbi:hypothetical protein SDC9_206823 [bioreactor metagenome]|uniref:Uncharacterized protein n=1 Tax=bioreactor metagenome TaxID=1076179 RepID=A0A645J5V6_9ZZZZ